MTAWTLCSLPGGYVDDTGAVHREAELRSLSGHDEEWLAERGVDNTPAAITRVLCECVRRIGTLRPVTPDIARGLLVADRQYLLLKLREVTFGDRIEGTLACPWPGCGAKVDIDFRTASIPVKRCEQVRATYDMAVSAEGRVRNVEFRLPTGEDQEELIEILARNPAEALTTLLERCVRPGSDGAPAADVLRALSPEARQRVEQAIEAAAPGLDLDMDVRCPECGRTFSIPFDLADFFFGELKTSRDLLYRQVHYLAYHYHWSERDILGMSRSRRLAYIDVLANEIEALNDVS